MCRKKLFSCENHQQLTWHPYLPSSLHHFAVILSNFLPFWTRILYFFTIFWQNFHPNRMDSRKKKNFFFTLCHFHFHYIFPLIKRSLKFGVYIFELIHLEEFCFIGERVKRGTLPWKVIVNYMSFLIISFLFCNYFIFMHGTLWFFLSSG